MVTERHCFRLIIKTLCKGDFGGNIIPQLLEVKHGWLNKVWSSRHEQPTGLYPNGYYQIFQWIDFDPARDRMVFAHCQLERNTDIKETHRLYILHAGIYTLSKSNIVMTEYQSNK